MAIKKIHKVLLLDMLNDVDTYGSLSDSLVNLPVPYSLKIGRKDYAIPKDMGELSENICYGQRLFLLRSEPNDIGLILRLIDGYYYPVVTGSKWNDSKALLFGNKVLKLPIKDLYPLGMHMNTLISELAERERKMLSREPTKMELAAGIEELSIYSELSAVDFLRVSLGKTEEVMLTPYIECLVRFQKARKENEYNERYFKLSQEDTKLKHK